jgi:hypothetical protein
MQGEFFVVCRDVGRFEQVETFPSEQADELLEGIGLVW